MEGRTHYADDATVAYIAKLEREVQELRDERFLRLDSARRKVWDEAIEAAAKIVESPMSIEEFYMNKPLEYFIRTIPNPYARKGEEE